MVFLVGTVAHFLVWKKMMNEHSCRGICGYYDVKSKFRNSENSIFRKYCSTCNLELISRYSMCPCCHNSFGNDGVL